MSQILKLGLVTLTRRLILRKICHALANANVRRCDNLLDGITVAISVRQFKILTLNAHWLIQEEEVKKLFPLGKYNIDTQNAYKHQIFIKTDKKKRRKKVKESIHVL